jgi:hypothetical protein
MVTERGAKRMQTKELLKRVNILDNKCWEFQGAKDSKERGIMRWEGEIRLAHRVFFESMLGPLKEGSKLIHHLPKGKCIGPSCCNPAHMKVWREGFPRPDVKLCKKGHVIDENNRITENRKTGVIARCRICRQEAWRNDKRKARQE